MQPRISTQCTLLEASETRPTEILRHEHGNLIKIIDFINRSINNREVSFEDQP